VIRIAETKVKNGEKSARPLHQIQKKIMNHMAHTKQYQRKLKAKGCIEIIQYKWSYISQRNGFAGEKMDSCAGEWEWDKKNSDADGRG
jgi:hypothetical protein